MLHERYDFEVALSRELTPSEILNLSSQSLHITSKRTPILSSNSNNKTLSHTIVSVSTKMEKVKETITQFAPIDFPVLITGETGTGKELVARTLHSFSSRAEKPFLAINCAAIPDALIESELFGHASGAFTGANTSYKGIFRNAEDGTVFLDEIGEISPRLQTALLRVLETGEVRPVGSSSTYKINCRIVTATNRNLFSLTKKQGFRSDLFFRLQRLEIHIPPLRDRTEDIIPLVTHFLNLGRYEEFATISEELGEAFKNYNWPGNVRELRNIVERMRVLSSDKLNYDIQDFLLNFHIEQNDLANLDENFTDIIESSNFESPLAGDIQSFLSNRRTKLRRKNRLRELFDEVEELTVSEAAVLIEVSSHTAARYLRDLCQEGFIKKVTPTASRKTNYYIKQIS